MSQTNSNVIQVKTQLPQHRRAGLLFLRGYNIITVQVSAEVMATLLADSHLQVSIVTTESVAERIRTGSANIISTIQPLTGGITVQARNLLNNAMGMLDNLGEPVDLQAVANKLPNETAAELEPPTPAAVNQSIIERAEAIKAATTGFDVTPKRPNLPSDTEIKTAVAAVEVPEGKAPTVKAVNEKLKAAELPGVKRVDVDAAVAAEAPNAYDIKEAVVVADTLSPEPPEVINMDAVNQSLAEQGKATVSSKDVAESIGLSL